MLLGVLINKNVYAIDKCARIQKDFINQIEKIFKNINSLETCIKPATKYRLKSCIKRKQEGSKGFNCLPELSKALNSNKNYDCEVRLGETKLLFKHLVRLDNTAC